MKIAFIMPCVGRKRGEPYVKTWQMEPLVFAVLAALTPKEIDRVLIDDRLEAVPYGDPVDLVAISVETYTARRAYQIASEFRKRKVPVVMGGFHATLCPGEVMEHADSVVIGQAERTWPVLLRDFLIGTLGRSYEEKGMPDLSGIFPDRSVYGTKRYAKITLVETGRGCPFTCEFCSITSFFGRRTNLRPVADVVRELQSLGRRSVVFFIDDNIAADPARASELFLAMAPLGIRWVGQVSINVARDERLLQRMKDSGCLGVLVGFESLDPANLSTMGKAVNRAACDYDACLTAFRRHHMIIYATFMFGYDRDSAASFAQAYSFILRHRFFFAAFNHVVPFPGTPLYERLQKENRLLHDRWWLDPDYRFGDVAFKPAGLGAQEISALCVAYRHRIYGLPSIVLRGLDVSCNCRGFFRAAAFFALNLLSAGDVDRRQGLPLGA
jgi:radical SAM superfamily enzyme YgiQ (UPF0313 family)